MQDSGAREIGENGGVREPQSGRPRFDLLIPRNQPYEMQLLTRFAQHMSEGAAKYSDRNWEKFNTVADLERCRASAFRHFIQWMSGVVDGEDHAAAVLFNIMAADHVADVIDGEYPHE